MLLDAEESQLVLVDYQAKLMPAIHEGDLVLANAVRLARIAQLLQVPLWATEENAQGLGATVEAVLPDGRKLLRHCARDGSYMSASDPRVHFGLGAATSVKTLTVTWPGGKKTTLSDLAADKQVEVKEQ